MGTWIKARLQQGCAANEIGVFVRSDAELKRARAAVKAAGASAIELNDKNETEPGAVAISTMHFAKGLEFRSVVVMACDDDVIPQSARKREFVSENGADLNAILPKMSPLNPQFRTKKQTVFQKISSFVEKFKGVGGEI